MTWKTRKTSQGYLVYGNNYSFNINNKKDAEKLAELLNRKTPENIKNKINTLETELNEMKEMIKEC